jgi:hypothetical protein
MRGRRSGNRPPSTSALAHSLALARERIPDLGRRRLTHQDLVQTCAREGVQLRLEPALLDERLTRRGGPPTITINAALMPDYRVFLGFHALGHWLFHPGSKEYYLGSPGWLDKIECEASTLGFLALFPYPGPPYPIVQRSRIDEAWVHLWVRYPARLSVRGRRGGEEGSLSPRIQHTVLPRYRDQLEFEW